MPREVGEDLGDCDQCPAVPGGARPQMSPDRHTAAPAWPSPPCPPVPSSVGDRGRGTWAPPKQTASHRPPELSAWGAHCCGLAPRARGRTLTRGLWVHSLEGPGRHGAGVPESRTPARAPGHGPPVSVSQDFQAQKALPGQVPPAGAYGLGALGLAVPFAPTWSARFLRHLEEGRPWPQAPAWAQPRSNLPGLWAGAS